MFTHARPRERDDADILASIETLRAARLGWGRDTITTGLGP